MGGAVSSGLDLDDLVDKLMSANYISTPNVELAFRAVDRALYFLPECVEGAYRDLAWKCDNLHISAPSIYALVMESLELKPGLSFLNLGSGTGYLSTMVGLILGPYGVNHGIELYQDVIDYAYVKLQEFKRTSPALDCSEFCEPTFVRGNSLCLSCDSRQYDRVYCGATCPKNCELYMKNLLKVGGVLVMPLNDSLLQIKRKTESTWESKRLLSVSFSILQLPTLKENKTIALPELKVVRLDEACRAVIRSELRKRSLEEAPNLVIRPRKFQLPKHSQPRVRLFPNLIIPLMDLSDDDQSYQGTEDEESCPDSPITLSRRRTMSERSSGSEREVRYKREKFGSGVATGDDYSTDSTLSPPTASDSSTNSSMEIDQRPPSRTKIYKHHMGKVRIRYKLRKSKKEKNASGNGGKVESSVGSNSGPSETKTDDNTDGAEAKSEGSPAAPPRPVPLYSTVMREKIQLLPLPSTLKDYLNYYRPF